MADPIKAPAHYAGDGEVDCMRAMRSMQYGWVNAFFTAPAGKCPLDRIAAMLTACYWSTTAFKYVWRWPGRNGVEDLKKARQCIDYAIQAMEVDG